MDTQALSTLPTQLLVNFPDRPAVTFRRTRHEGGTSGSFVWTGSGDDCSADFSALPGVVRGNFSCFNATYGVEKAARSYVLGRYRDDPAGTLPKAVDAPQTAPPAPSWLAEELPVQPTTPSAIQQDDSIDILVLYAPQVRAHFDPSGGKTGTMVFAKQCVTVLQDAMQRSASPPPPMSPPITPPPLLKVNFLTAKEVSGPTPPATAIYDYQDYVTLSAYPNTLRNRYGADVVMYLTPDQNFDYYGTSIVPGSTGSAGGVTQPIPGPLYAPKANAIVQYNVAIDDLTSSSQKEPYTFMHEFGHIIGANHDDDNANNTTPLEPAGFAWFRATGGDGNRTLVSYHVPTCPGNCERVLNYSNPDVTVFGFRTGNPSHNNAHLIKDFAMQPAQYRASFNRIFYDGLDD